MKRLLVIACAGLPASGCAGLDPSKLLPSAVTTFQTAVGNTTTTETKLIAAWQAENRGLLYLSGGDYSCGDPNSALYKRYASSNNPSTLVTQDQVSKYWTSSLKYLTAYVTLLKTIATQAQTDQATIKQIVSFGSTAASHIPGISSSAASSALSALGTVASDLTGIIAIEQISAAAQNAQHPLKIAVGYLEQYYPKFLTNEQVAFNACDECANERLLFIRDQPLEKIANYKKTYFVTANGLDLDNAYQAYRTQRQSFILDGSAKTIDKTLEQIIAQNTKLADPSLDWNTFQTAVQSLNTLYTDVSNAASAVEKFGTASKPVPAPKAGPSASSSSTTHAAATGSVVAWAD